MENCLGIIIENDQTIDEGQKRQFLRDRECQKSRRKRSHGLFQLLMLSHLMQNKKKLISDRIKTQGKGKNLSLDLTEIETKTVSLFEYNKILEIKISFIIRRNLSIFKLNIYALMTNCRIHQI